MITTINIDGIDIDRKVKFLVKIDTATYNCLSAQHVSALLQKHGHAFSACDIYNYCNPKRPKLRLQKRLPENITISKL